MTRSSLSLHATCVIAYEKFDEIGHLSNAVIRPHTKRERSQRLYSKCERLNCRVSIGIGYFDTSCHSILFVLWPLVNQIG